MSTATDGEATIAVEQAQVLAQQAYAGDQYVLRLRAPYCAAQALPGSFVHLQCGASLPMRRPFSIMRSDAEAGWIDILYRACGDGTRLLSQQRTGTVLSLLGPIGRPFELEAPRRRPLLIGGGVGIPPMVFLAQHIVRGGLRYDPVVFMGSEAPFPFEARPSRLLLDGVPADVIATMPLLDEWEVPCRLASLQGYAGCYEGYVTELARRWLESLSAGERESVAMYACGPHPMLAAAARLAADFGLPCQVSLEEFMACAVGGCAGCTVKVRTPQGPAMKRVCVDGPVFDAATVF